LDFLACKLDKEPAQTLALMQDLPKEKELDSVSFIVHATRGVIRDQQTRRKAMAILLALAVLMLLAGFTVLQSFMNPREHPWFVILFWVTCVWLTFTAVLLALFDLLIIRLDARRARRVIREKLEVETSNE
jgi:biotin transporter BioY